MKIDSSTLPTMKTDNEDSIVTLQKLLDDPQYRLKGAQFISDIEYAIYLIQKYRKEQADFLDKAIMALSPNQNQPYTV